MISKDSRYYSGKKKAAIVEDAKSIDLKSIECHEGKGLVGDRFYNYKEDFKGQVTFMSYDYHLELQKFLGREFSIELYRRNIFVTGKDPVDLVGKKFIVGDVEFLGVEDCAPCIWMERMIGKGALEWMKKNKSGGLRAKVLNSSILKVGDELKD